MEKITIHMEKPNTLSKFISEKERKEVVLLKITGFIGEKDFDDVLDEMCEVWGKYDENDNFIPDYDDCSAIRHLDLGDATFVYGDVLPYFGHHTQLETLILPQGIKSTTDEYETGITESESIISLVLPHSLKVVEGFQSCPKLKGIVLPESLENIKPFAFYGCSSITSIRIPASVKEMDGSCFAGCNIQAYEVDEKNPYYTVVDGVVYSKDLAVLVAFPSASPIKHFVIPPKTKIIGEMSFMDSHIENIILPEGLFAIEEGAFRGSNIRKIIIPDTVTEIGKLAFSDCFELKYVRLSKCLSTIPSQMFSSCPKLKELDIPSSVKTIFYSAIAWSCGLEHLYLHDGLEEIVDEGPMLGCCGEIWDVKFPKTLKKIPGGVFNFSSSLKKYRLDTANPYFKLISEALCSKDGKILYSVPDYSRTSFVIPEGVEVIAERAFAFLDNLHDIKLPLTLKVIESRAFQGCKSLNHIQIPAYVTKVDIDAFLADNIKTIVIYCSVPPKMTGKMINNEWRYRDVELYVPEGCVPLYKKASGWKCFKVREMKCE